MNSERLTSQTQDLWIQRCADGELVDSDQIQLVQFLDEDDRCEGWRQLAIGFLENQSFQQAFQAPVSAHVPDPADTTSSATVPSTDQARRLDSEPNRSQPPRSRLLTMAASLLLGLISGFALFATLQSQDATQTGSLVVDQDAAPQPEIQTAELGASAETRFANDGSSNGQQPPGQYLQLTRDAGEAPNQIMIPLVANEQEARLRRFHERREQILRQLQEQGYEIERRPHMYRFPIDGEREVVVPSDRVRVRYAVQ